MTHEVFISHASAEAAAAAQVCGALEADGITCWIAPRDISPGSEYAEQLVQAIRDARILLVVFSKAAADSEHIRRELDCAVSAGIAVLPVRIEELEPSGALQYYLAGRQWCDAFPAPLEPHLEQVRGAVADLLASKEPVSPAARAGRKRRTSVLFAAVALLGAAVVAALAAWTLMPSKTPVKTGAATLHATALTATQIAAKYGTSVVDVTAKVPRVAHHKLTWKTVTKPGVIASKDGLVYTSGVPLNNAPLGWYAQVVTVGVYGNAGQYRTVQGRRLDPGYDDGGYAIFKVDPRKAQLHPMPLGDPLSLTRGDPVVILGRHYTDLWQVTAAIQRVLHDPSPSLNRVNAMMTDAGFMKPRMGCPVIDTTGHLVGVMGSYNDPLAGYYGNDAAVSVSWFTNAATWYQRQVVRWPSRWLGVTVRTVTAPLARSFGLAADSGALVQFVVPGSPAAAAGIRGGSRAAKAQGRLQRDWDRELHKGMAWDSSMTPNECVLGGDIIVSVNGKAVKTAGRLAEVLFTKTKVGEVVSIHLLRGDTPMTVKAKLAANLRWSPPSSL